MLHGSPSPGVAGSELTRLLARLADTPMAPPRPAFAERLGHWLGWPGAVALSAALNASPAPTGAGRLRRRDDEEADFQRVRAALQASIAAGPREPASSPTDFGPHRRHCIAQQQAMHDAVAALRQRLRQALARHSARGARLAAIDAVLEQALATQEQGLLGLVLLRLQAHFERLQHTAAAERPWHETFRDDRDRLLQTELAHRLLPAQGLLDALRTTQPT
jgi:hypothetical protein